MIQSSSKLCNGLRGGSLMTQTKENWSINNGGELGRRVGEAEVREGRG